MLAPMNFASPFMKRVVSLSDLPDNGYIIQFNGSYTVHHPDEGVWAPGHGYPAYDETVALVEQYVSVDEAKWKESIWALMVVDKNRKDFVAFKYQRPIIETTVNVRVD